MIGFDQGLLTLPFNARILAHFAPCFVNFSCNTQGITAKICLA